jgi:rhodanese-related sulfurtransferase
MWPFSRGSSGVAVGDVDVREAYDLCRRGAKLVDVRSPGEFRGSRAKGARNVSPDQIKRDATGLKRDDELLVICASGHRSSRAARQLAGMGFTNVSNVRGGLHAWTSAGLPLKK